MHGQAGYKEHGFALYGQGKRMLNCSNHCILDVLAEEMDGQTRNSGKLVCGKYVHEECASKYKFAFCSRL
jgi:hypothetical protein